MHLIQPNLPILGAFFINNIKKNSVFLKIENSFLGAHYPIGPTTLDLSTEFTSHHCTNRQIIFKIDELKLGPQ